MAYRISKYSHNRYYILEVDIIPIGSWDGHFTDYFEEHPEQLLTADPSYPDAKVLWKIRDAKDVATTKADAVIMVKKVIQERIDALNEVAGQVQAEIDVLKDQMKNKDWSKFIESY